MGERFYRITLAEADALAHCTRVAWRANAGTAMTAREHKQYELALQVAADVSARSAAAALRKSQRAATREHFKRGTRVFVVAGQYKGRAGISKGWYAGLVSVQLDGGPQTAVRVSSVKVAP